MTIATLMGTCLIFIAVKWTGHVYEPMALVVGGMICIAAANAGATSQDLKTGYLVGATPKYQQIALFVGAIVSSLAIGATIKILDTANCCNGSTGYSSCNWYRYIPCSAGNIDGYTDKRHSFL